MKVILREEVHNLGQTGDTVKVAAGYARNFLLPNKLAVRADSGNAKQIEHERRVIQLRDEKRRAVMAESAKKIEGVTLEFQVRAGAEDKIFGSVTAAHIAEKLAEAGHEIDRRAVLLDEPIKALGIFAVPVRLAAGIEPSIKVWVSGLEEAQADVAHESTEEPEAS